ncbi:exonuclease domain-containing protein [Kribbella sp. NPDC059898]|uniref:3'-5' exonuclease n=1 Tax=Kribbella sp. NPDC059898 TaxID=3346995 RepID=UPI003662E413
MAESNSPWSAFDYAVVDVEGNGQQPPDLVEISIVAIKNGSIGQARSWLVRPPRPITAMARRFHRITDEQVADAPTVTDIDAELRTALDSMVFVAHNAGIDLGVVSRELQGYQPKQVLDTLKLARRLLPGRDSYKLGALVDALDLAKGLSPDLAPHRATYDAIVCARLFVHLATPPGREPLTLAELLNTAPNKSTTDAADDPAATLF